MELLHTVYLMEYKEFNQLVHRYYPELGDYDYTERCLYLNGTDRLYTNITGEYVDEETIADICNLSPYGILEVMVYNKQLEPGNYIIRTSW